MDLKGRPGSSVRLKEASPRVGLGAAVRGERKPFTTVKRRGVGGATTGEMCSAALLFNISLTFQISGQKILINSTAMAGNLGLGASLRRSCNRD